MDTADARPWVHRLGLRNELFLLLLCEVIEALGDKVGMQICGGVDADVASGQVLQAILSSMFLAGQHSVGRSRLFLMVCIGELGLDAEVFVQVVCRLLWKRSAS